MNRVMGIDLSLVETGLCLLDGGDLVWKMLVKSQPDQSVKEIERIQKIARTVTGYIDTYKPDLIVIEGLSYGSKNTTSLCQLAKLNFSIEIYCHQMGHHYLIIAPTHLKKFVTGKGNAKKEVMLMKILKRYGLEFENNNLADAYALCRLGEDYLSSCKSDFKGVKTNGN